MDLGVPKHILAQPHAHPTQNEESCWQLRDVKGDPQVGSNRDTGLALTGASSSVAPPQDHEPQG